MDVLIAGVGKNGITATDVENLAILYLTSVGEASSTQLVLDRLSNGEDFGRFQRDGTLDMQLTPTQKISIQASADALRFNSYSRNGFRESEEDVFTRLITDYFSSRNQSE